MSISADGARGRAQRFRPGTSTSAVQVLGQSSSQCIEGPVTVVEVTTIQMHVTLRLQADLGPRAKTRPQLQLDRDPSSQPRATEQSAQPPGTARLKARRLEHEPASYPHVRVVGAATPPVREIGEQRRIQS